MGRPRTRHPSSRPHSPRHDRPSRHGAAALTRCRDQLAGRCRRCAPRAARPRRGARDRHLRDARRPARAGGRIRRHALTRAPRAAHRTGGRMRSASRAVARELGRPLSRARDRASRRRNGPRAPRLPARERRVRRARDPLRWTRARRGARDVHRCAARGRRTRADRPLPRVRHGDPWHRPRRGGACRDGATAGGSARRAQRRPPRDGTRRCRSGRRGTVGGDASGRRRRARRIGDRHPCGRGEHRPRDPLARGDRALPAPRRTRSIRADGRHRPARAGAAGARRDRGGGLRGRSGHRRTARAP